MREPYPRLLKEVGDLVVHYSCAFEDLSHL